MCRQNEAQEARAIHKRYSCPVLLEGRASHLRFQSLDWNAYVLRYRACYLGLDSREANPLVLAGYAEEGNGLANARLGRQNHVGWAWSYR